MRVAVAGGTGLIGRMVVDTLQLGGDTAVVVARSVGVDLLTGAGLDHALAGVEAVIDVSNIVTTRRGTAVRFFGTATRALLAGGQRAGVTHHIVLSIVGVDRVPWGYYEGKRHQEQLALEGPVPATVLRSTQFHEFADQMLQRGGPVVLVPKPHHASRSTATSTAQQWRAVPGGGRCGNGLLVQCLQNSNILR